MLKYEALTKYIPCLSGSDFGDFVIEKSKEGVMRFPYAVFNDNVNAFTYDFEKFLSVSNELDVSEYQDVLCKCGISANYESVINADITKLNGVQILALILCVIRHNRFCEGVLLNAFNDGHIVRWLNRLKEIDEMSIENIIYKTIKEIWVNEIAKDYELGWLLKEDTLKNSLYYHLRSKLGKLFEDNNIRVFTEFTDDKFRGKHKIPDMVIAKVPAEQVSDYWGNDVIECLAVIEIKFKNGYKSSEDIFNDYEKLKYYKTELGVDCKPYMATIWEYEDGETNWERKNSAWAKNTLTELNASYDIEKTDEYKMRFYVWEH